MTPQAMIELAGTRWTAMSIEKRERWLNAAGFAAKWSTHDWDALPRFVQIRYEMDSRP